MDTPRIVAPNEMSDVLAMSWAIMSLCRNYTTDAVVVFPGMGEKDRIEQAIRFWKLINLKDPDGTHFLLIAGINKQERTFEEINLKMLNDKYAISEHPQENIHIITHTENTKEQAEWLRDKVLELKIKNVTLITSYYHLTRAYLTVLKTFIKANMRIPILPFAVATSPQTFSPEIKETQDALVPGEIDRILKYQKTNDAATKEELLKYLSWLWITYKYSFIYPIL